MNPVPFPLLDAARRELRAGNHRPAAPRGLQRNLADGLRVPVERPVLLRIRAALRHHVRRRCAQHGRHRQCERPRTRESVHQRESSPGERRRRRDAAKRHRRRADSPRRLCGSRSGSRSWGARASTASFEVFNLFNHANYGSYTRAGKQPAVRAAVVQPECGVSAADGAVGIPTRILIDRTSL